MSNTAICIVANFKYLKRHLNNFTYELRTIGKFSGELILITHLFTPTFLFSVLRRDKNLTIIRKKNVKFSNNYKKIQLSFKPIDKPNRFKTKKFQWHKIYLFDYKMKNWDYIFYLDLNMHIHHDLNLVLNFKPKNIFSARADGYPNYINKLESQFQNGNDFFDKLSKNYDLNIKTYFQTGVMYFDTSIINNNTFNEIVNLAEEYPISITNEQGILNIYFIFIKKIFNELINEVDNKLVYYYWVLPNKEIFITKQLVEKYK